MQGREIRHRDVQFPPTFAHVGNAQRPRVDRADPYRPRREPRKCIVAQIGVGQGAEHGAGLGAHEPQDAEMLSAVDNLGIGERCGVPAQDVLVVALGRRRAREVVTVRREPGDGELRGDTTGLGQHVGESDAADRPRRAVRAEALDEGGGAHPGDLELRKRGEIHEAGPVAHRPALGRHRLPPGGAPERERHIARVILWLGP